MSEIAWAGGFFEGEGCWGLNRGVPVARITQVDREPLERFRQAVGMGKVYGPYGPYRGQKSQIFSYDVSGEARIEKLLSVLRPWLCSRRIQRAEDTLRCARDGWLILPKLR